MKTSTPKWHLNARILKRYCVWLGKILALVNYSRKAAVMAWIFYGDLPGAVISNSLTFHFSTPSVIIHSSNQKLFYIIDYGTGGSMAPRFKSSLFVFFNLKSPTCCMSEANILLAKLSKHLNCEMWAPDQSYKGFKYYFADIIWR